MAAAGDLTDEERRALRGSKFAPLPAPTAPSRPQPRMAHPGGPLTTNKAAALAKFLERKLQQPDGLESLNPDLVKLAVRNAKETIKASKGEPSTSGRIVRHVSSFGDSSEDSDDSKDGEETKGVKRKRKNKSYHIAQKDKSFQNGGEQSKKKKKNKKKNLKAAKDSKSQKASKKKKLKSL
ncbi:uncharacterized protein [Oryza sativa Japonica Group]|uniref:Uncharacterized protein n=2 Tax=Oryza sativa TaxID=4530 RepID=B9FUS7_ORYSJ|nr:nucleolar protein 58 isoform X1 [Oryza sativa Japonica Group]EEC82657.1 hypothetical protein OsI_27273 [Oryza sativa Indica Group]EEE67784.1 hypothetical protein OsJ_25515 [Oryza sativa Japonica Group]KAF2924424.1 hypothetical protein DAI22_07g267600 [Oryza sativa Japonica Group]